ncbi:hypothetical protein Tco_0664792 [Tanacetum coccineum]
MSTRSSSSNLVPPSTNPESIIRNRRRNLGDPSLLLDFEEINMANDPNNVQGPPPVGPNFQNPNPDLRLMEELLQAPTDGVGDAIVVPPILANQFELKIGLLNLVTAIAFHGFENDDPHSHIRRFMKITQTVKLNNVPSDVVKLLLFLFSLEGAARTWLEKEPPNSITTGTILNKPQVSSASGSSTQDAAIIALTKQVEALVSSMNRLINSIQNGYETCGGPQAYYECQAAIGYTKGRTCLLRVLHERPQGALPSNTEPNLRKQVNSITTRSGLTTVEPSIPPHVPPTPRVELEKEPETLMNKVHITSLASTAHVPPPGIQPVSPPKPKEDPTPKPYQPKIPYPSRLNKTKLLDKNDVQVPEKLGDPGKFLIPCILQDLEVCSSLADSGASINLMSLLIYEKLGIAEDVIVRVDKFNFLADFVIVDFEVDHRVPIILGRPFLRTAKALNPPSRECHSVYSINIIDSPYEEISNQNKQSSGSTTSHSDLPLPDYEVFCFKEKSSGSTTSHSDHSLPEYESFFFDVDHIEEKSSGSTTSHFDLSLLEYDSFHFNLLIDQLPPADRSDSHHEEFADKLTYIISSTEYDCFYFDIEPDLRELTTLFEENISKDSTKELTSPELNNFPFFLSDCDSIFSDKLQKVA